MSQSSQNQQEAVRPFPAGTPEAHPGDSTSVMALGLALTEAVTEIQVREILVSYALLPLEFLPPPSETTNFASTPPLPPLPAEKLSEIMERFRHERRLSDSVFSDSFADVTTFAFRSLKRARLYDAAQQALSAHTSGGSIPSETGETEVYRTQRFQALVENSGDFIGMATLDGNVFYVNIAGREMVGLEGGKAAVLGKTMTDFCPPETCERIENFGVPVVRSVERWRSEEKLRHFQTGELIDIEMTLFTVTDPQTGEPLCFATVARDIRERKRLETALHENERRFRALAESAPLFVWMTDAAGLCEYINPQWTQYTGLTLEETRRRQLDQIVHPDDFASMLSRWEVAFREGKEYTLEFRLKSADDGTYRWFLARSLPFRNSEGDIIHWFGVTTDIHDLKTAEEERQQHLAEIEDLNTRLQRTVAESHHRIKNNLQVLAALVEMQKTCLRETVPVAGLNRLGQNIRSLATLHDLLTLESKSGGEVLSVSLKAALEKLVTMLRATMPEHTLHLTAEDIPLPVRHGSSFVLLVNEAVSNAIKHGAGEIHIALTWDSNRVRLSIHDNGPGFPAYFDPKTSANTGLELIESLGRWDLQGEIAYTNRPEGGAQVVVLFPLPE